MNVLSLFDGMSCGQLALQRAGVYVSNYYASEIDKYAMKVTMANFPNTIQVGSVVDLETFHLPEIDLLIGGSPCQGFSFAGKQLNFEDERSKLFFEYVRLLRGLRPKYFLLENVKMKKEYQDIISEHLGVQPIEINSSLVSAQNRKRLYWTNIQGITQLVDKGIFLKDIIDDCEFVTHTNMSGIETPHYDKTCALRANASANYQLVYGAAQRGRYNENGKAEQQIECNETEKSNALTSVAKDSLIIEVKSDLKYSVFKEKSQTILSTIFKENPKSMLKRNKMGLLVDSGYSIRKLTPIECERLQTVPDNEKILIFDLCYDQAKTFVNAVKKSLKLQKLVLSAEKTEIKEYVKNVLNILSVKNLKNNFIVAELADILILKHKEKVIEASQIDDFINAGHVENKMTSLPQDFGEDSVIQNVFINTIEGKIIHFGMEELVQKEQNLFLLKNGKKQLKQYGKEIMQLVEDVEKSLIINQISNSTSTTSFHLSIKNLELILSIYYCFAEFVIHGYTQNKILQNSLSLNFHLRDGYTNHVSNSQRYKMLGNGWTIDIIAHIFSFIDK